ncbi:MAG: 1-hydroxycarotenoid 3,4-desaturase CrtD [Pseudomonadota bacterium]
MSDFDVVIAGAGMGGLAAAIELQAAGLRVLVVERADKPGGKMRQVDVDGHKIDSGPTVLTMRWVFDALFETAGTRLEDHVGLKRADVLARHVWDNGEPNRTLDLYADTKQSHEAIADFAGIREANGYLEFCEETRQIFNTLRDPYMCAQRPGLFDLPLRVGLSKLGALYRTRPFMRMWDALGRHFRDPRLHQLFGRYATYCGSSPYQAAATLMLVAHVEQEGVWLVNGGMHNLARALENAARDLGVEFSYGTAVTKITSKNNAVTGVLLSNGSYINSTQVVTNSDVAAIATGLFGPQVQSAVPLMASDERSLSALTWSAFTKTSGFPLAHHSVFFSLDYKAEFNDLFNHGRVPEKPTVYICAQDRDDAGAGVGGAEERLLILVNAPATGDQSDFDKPIVDECRERTFSLLQRCGLEIDPSEERMIATTPADFNQLFPATGGALYGRASHGWRASFKRPAADTPIKGLYLAGGSAHPGPGIPMATLSGRLAAERVLAARPRVHGVGSIPQKYLEAAQ